MPAYRSSLYPLSMPVRSVRPFVRTLFLAAGLLTLLASTAAAQRDTTVVLPDIAPREVEIRGQIEIAFPSLRRQPLTGFNPPPRVPGLPVDRRPYLGDYLQRAADLPGSPLRRPESPEALTAAVFPPAGGELAFWAGRYFSRGARAQLHRPLSERVGLGVRAYYDGQAGHSPIENEPDIETRSDAVEGDVRLAHHGRRWTTALTAGGFYETYTLFAAVPSIDRLLGEPVRKGGGGYGELSARTVGGTDLTAQGHLRFGGTQYETRRFEDRMLIGALQLRSQQHVAGSVEVGAALPRGTAVMSGDLRVLGLGADVDPVRAADVELGVRFRVRRLQATVGAAVLAGSVDRDDLPDAERTINRLAPAVELAVTPRTGLRLYAHTRPHVDAPALADAYRIHPYLVSQPDIRPSIHWLDAEGGVQLYRGPVQAGVHGGFQDVRQFRYVVDAVPSDGLDGYLRGLFAFRYADAQIATVGGHVGVILPGAVHATVRASYRDGRFKTLDGEIPYFAPFTSETSLSYSFARSRGLLQVTGRVEGYRPVGRQNAPSFGPTVLFDTSVSFQMTRYLGVLAGLDNLSFGYNERWPNYPVSPSIFHGGIQVVW